MTAAAAKITKTPKAAKPHPRPVIVKSEPRPTMASLARAALRTAAGDTRKAIASLSKQLLKDERLLREVVGEAVMMATETAVRDRISIDRRTIMTSAANAKGDVLALANGVKRAILDFPLSNGITLRDAARLAATQLTATFHLSLFSLQRHALPLSAPRRSASPLNSTPPHRLARRYP